MKRGVPASAARISIIRFIHAAGPAGVTSEQVVQHTGLAPIVARMHIKNLVRLGDAASGPSAMGGRLRVYTSNLIRPPAMPEERHTGLQDIMPLPTEKNLARITKATERSPNISPERKRMEDTLRRQTCSKSSAEMAALAGISKKQAAQLLARIARDGTAAITGKNEHGHFVFLWAQTHRANASRSYNLPIRNSTMTEPYTPPDMTPVRPGAADHEKVPSRRADGWVNHRPLMCMGSGVRGGM